MRHLSRIKSHARSKAQHKRLTTESTRRKKLKHRNVNKKKQIWVQSNTTKFSFL